MKDGKNGGSNKGAHTNSPNTPKLSAKPSAVEHKGDSPATSKNPRVAELSGSGRSTPEGSPKPKRSLSQTVLEKANTIKRAFSKDKISEIPEHDKAAPLTDAEKAALKDKFDARFENALRHQDGFKHSLKDHLPASYQDRKQSVGPNWDELAPEVQAPPSEGAVEYAKAFMQNVNARKAAENAQQSKQNNRSFLDATFSDKLSDSGHMSKGDPHSVDWNEVSPKHQREAAPHREGVENTTPETKKFSFKNLSKKDKDTEQAPGSPSQSRKPTQKGSDKGPGV